jgi:hypothetical protein
LFLAATVAPPASLSAAAEVGPPSLPRAELRPAPRIVMPHDVDCNVPCHWDGEQFFVFNSTGHPYRSSGKDLFLPAMACSTVGIT